MKKIILFILGICLFSSIYASNRIAASSEQIRDILFPNWLILKKENLDKGPILSTEININRFIGENGNEEWWHVACYNMGGISTIIEKSEEGDSLEYYKIGKQSVFMADETSYSLDYSVEKIFGKSYIVHHHKGFKVYSTHDEQFVVAN